MTNRKEERILNIILIISAVVILVTLIWACSEFEKERLERVEVIQQCEHEYAITSRYNLLVGSYKTISKCVKCGKEVH